MYNVKKRTGKIVNFELSKISQAIKLAFDAQEKQYNQEIIDFLALKVTANFEPKIKDGLIAVEDIQDSVENVLVQAGYSDVAKAYILYRRQHEKIRNMKNTILDYKEIVNDYLGNNDWRVKENATVTYSGGGLILSNSGAITANYWLSEVYDDEIANAHRNADIHIHDLSMLTGYCAGSAECREKSLLRPQAILQPFATRWSTSSGLCRTNGQAPRHFLPSTPISPPLLKWTTSALNR